MMIVAAALLLATVANVDTDPPIIEDLAAASSNPEAAPVITVMLADPGTGVGTARVVFRAIGGAWQKAELKGGTQGLFIARLPDGLQRSGFEYYVEATDVAGNGPSRIGSADVPIRVERAKEPTIKRLERQKAEHAEPGPTIHPAWLMLSLGVGVLASAGAGAYGLDWSGVNGEIGTVDADLAKPGLSPAAVTALQGRKANLTSAATQDGIICTVMGVIGGAGLVTGTALVIVSSLNE